MTIYQFTGLHQKEKAKVVLESMYLAHRTEKDVLFQLYYLSEFFVEIWGSADRKVIYGMKPFATNRSLEPYLKSLCITELTGLLKA